MSAAAAERTILPPVESLDDLIRVFETATEAELVTPAGDRLVVPQELFEVLRSVVQAMANGQAVTVAPHHQALTTQEAADLLNISRPTLVKLLDQGEMPFHRPGRHRRVLLRDVLEYQERRRHERRAALDDLVEMSEEAGLYDATARPRETR
ncbi:helix-turn-helix domain-containing protein [Streptomyces lycii]|uniref:Helix-turn-helix domain-containing protein n=1 Tax=Streptomyces lycii TaxID=2654337 RepID=A0ABQ7FN23_9ACTN|nr:helix-turn-helix domain-containing protein [Streptomyces lycii]KAF4410117.1 helix-turn-helix domain-containing protein [Streptomyces lycii]